MEQDEEEKMGTRVMMREMEILLTQLTNQKGNKQTIKHILSIMYLVDPLLT